ncbi:MAG: hypothetical protein HYY25_07225 [Candidatus Wallbacteria bacterium]|nr:hypothetical protein [Candidatus Wallbacteria bacterium]
MRAALRKQVARRAAELMYHDGVKEYLRAKRKAARELGTTVYPNNLEIKEALDLLANQLEGPARAVRLLALRQRALEVMLALEPFSPRLIGSVLSGQIRRTSDIDIHAFTDVHELLAERLSAAGMEPALELVRVRKGGQEREFPHYYVEFPEGLADISVYPAEELKRPQRSSVTHRTMERATIGRLRRLLAQTAEAGQPMATDPGGPARAGDPDGSGP